MRRIWITRHQGTHLHIQLYSGRGNVGQRGQCPHGFSMSPSSSFHVISDPPSPILKCYCNVSTASVATCCRSLLILLMWHLVTWFKLFYNKYTIHLIRILTFMEIWEVRNYGLTFLFAYWVLLFFIVQREIIKRHKKVSSLTFNSICIGTHIFELTLL